jgi:SNF2 family DNA or RNA helicase
MFLTFEKGGFVIRDADADESLEELIYEKVHDSASYHKGYRRWLIPVTANTAKALVEHLHMEIPKDALPLIEYDGRASLARDKANRIMEMDNDQLQTLLDKSQVEFSIKPFPHQVRGVAYALANPRCALFYDTGTGKTFTVIHVISTLMKRGLDKTLVIAPKSILRVGWGADIEEFSGLRWADISDPIPPTTNVCPECQRLFKRGISKKHILDHMELDEFYALYPQARPKNSWTKEELIGWHLDRDADVYVMNPEAFKIYRDLIPPDLWDMVVIDESSMLKSPTSQTTRALVAFGAPVKRKIILSGTPRPNSNLDLWGQMSFLEPGLWPSFKKFRDAYFESDYQGWSWRPRPGSDRKIKKILAKRSLRVKLRDCVDLPEETYLDMEVELKGKLLTHYKSMLEEMIVELDGSDVMTDYQLVQMNKLAQITSGFIYDEEKKPHYLGDNPKIKETVRLATNLIVDEDRPVVIWLRFPAIEGKILEESLKMFGVSTLHSGTKNIEKSVNDFKSGKNMVMIAHPLSAKFGHTWVHCNAAIFHSYDYSWENYYQAKHRILRIGQKRPVTYFNIVARKTVDKIIMKKLKAKESSSALMLDSGDIEELRRGLS